MLSTSSIEASVTSSTNAAATSSSLPSTTSRSLHLGVIIGGTAGGVVAIVWFLGLMWFAHRHSWFGRPGHKRQNELNEERGMDARRSPAAASIESAGPFGEPRSSPSLPQTRFGVRTFEQIPQSSGSNPPRTSFGDPPRTSFGDPPRTSFGDLSRTSFGDPPRMSLSQPLLVPPPPPLPNPRFDFSDPPRSTSFEGGPRSGFAERDRPHSGFRDYGRRSTSFGRLRRGFFGSGGVPKMDEWEGAGRRISVEPEVKEMEELSGVWGLLTRARDHVVWKKRIKGEYKKDMRRVGSRSAVESDYRQY